MPMWLSDLLFIDNGRKYSWTLMNFASSELFNVLHKFSYLQVTLEMCINISANYEQFLIVTTVW